MVFECSINMEGVRWDLCPGFVWGLACENSLVIFSFPDKTLVTGSLRVVGKLLESFMDRGLMDGGKEKMEIEPVRVINTDGRRE